MKNSYVIILCLWLSACSGFVPKTEPVYMKDWDEDTHILTLGANNGWPQKTEIDMKQATAQAIRTCQSVFGYRNASLVQGEHHHCRLNMGTCVLGSQNVRYRCE